MVLGELSSFRSQLSIQRPQVSIIGSGGKVVETVTTDVADHIMLRRYSLANCFLIGSVFWVVRQVSEVNAPRTCLMTPNLISKRKY